MCMTWWEWRGARDGERVLGSARQWAAQGAIVALAALAGGCSSCDDDPWRAVTYLADAEAAASPPAPNCEVRARAAGDVAANPDLVEIAKLEIERDCYKAAEASVRQQLEAAQQSYVRLK
jgi:hypothetical protein